MSINLILREDKGTALTYAELDSNFKELKEQFDVIASPLSTGQVGGVLAKNIKQLVPSVAALRTIAGRYDGDVIYLAAHTQGTGKGGGNFKWDLTNVLADDDGVVIKPTNVVTGRWVRTLNGYVTPEMFGATGEGIVDESLLIQKASVYKSVDCRGSYIIDKINLLGGECFYSSNKKGKFIHKTVTTASQMFNLNTAAGVVYFVDLTLDGQRTLQHQDPVLIDLISSRVNPYELTLNVYGCLFKNIHSKAVVIQTNGIVRSKLNIVNSEFDDILELVDFDWNPSFVEFTENVDTYITGCSFSSGYEFTLDGAMAINHSSRLASSPVGDNYASVRIHGNRFTGLGRLAPVSGNALGCIELRLWTETTSITGNVFKGCYRTPIRAKTDCKEIVITGNSIQGSNGSGIEIVRGVSTGPIVGKIVISNNIVNICDIGITVSGGSTSIHKNVTISGNSISDIVGSGIVHSWGEVFTLTGNNILSCGGVPVDIQNTKVATISGNSIDTGGGDSGILFINGEDVICSNNNLKRVSNVGIRVGSVRNAIISENIVADRISTAGGNNVDFRVTSGVVAMVKNNIGTGISSFGFTTSKIDGNSWQ